MLSFLGYDSAAGLALRLRNASRQFWDFTALSWVSPENANTRAAFGETANGDGTSLYTVNVTLPSGGPHIQEVVLPTGEVVASDFAVEAATVTVDLSPVLDRLTIPEYVGPVVVIPAPPTPTVQTLYGNVKEFGAVAWSTGDTATMTIAQNQLVGAFVMEPVTRQATVGADGLFSFSPDKGAKDVTVKIQNSQGVVYFAMTINQISSDDQRNISSYL